MVRGETIPYMSNLKGRGGKRGKRAERHRALCCLERFCDNPASVGGRDWEGAVVVVEQASQTALISGLQ